MGQCDWVCCISGTKQRERLGYRQMPRACMEWAGPRRSKGRIGARPREGTGLGSAQVSGRVEILTRTASPNLSSLSSKIRVARVAHSSLAAITRALRAAVALPIPTATTFTVETTAMATIAAVPFVPFAFPFVLLFAAISTLPATISIMHFDWMECQVSWDVFAERMVRSISSVAASIMQVWILDPWRREGGHRSRKLLLSCTASTLLSLPGAAFRGTIHECKLKLSGIVDIMLKAMALSLNLDSDAFLESLGGKEMMDARFNYYPRCPRPTEIKG
ncbi:hypothetical protein CRG98_027003 [Punica granatum]|uniref:Uncharacterized protein n=1 Tax=Punica granatum TaxID=22663 RepID=A0A2I0J9I2_PUNGR|nr:hypothetical protein CRG98_027003 [Punica granatum]